jgi:hypothetical protein
MLECWNAGMHPGELMADVSFRGSRLMGAGLTLGTLASANQPGHRHVTRGGGGDTWLRSLAGVLAAGFMALLIGCARIGRRPFSPGDDEGEVCLRLRLVADMVVGVLHAGFSISISISSASASPYTLYTAGHFRTVPEPRPRPRPGLGPN